MNTVTNNSVPVSGEDWKVSFIGPRSQELYKQWIDEVRSLIAACQDPRPNRLEVLGALKKALMRIRDKIIGSNCRKFFFMQQGLLQVLLPLLWLKDETDASFMAGVAECQKDTLTLFSVLIDQHQSDQLSADTLSSLTSAAEIFSNLLGILQNYQISPEKNVKFFEVLSRSLVCFARRIEGTRNAVFEGNNFPILLHLLDPSHSNSVISQNIAGILTASCNSKLKQATLLESKLLPTVLGMLRNVCVFDALGRVVITDLRVLDGAIDLLCTLTSDCPEASIQVVTIPIFGNQVVKTPTLFYQILTIPSISTELKLKACRLIINLYRANSLKAHLTETQNTLLGYLIGLIDGIDDFSMRASYLLAFVVADDEVLQNVAMQMNIINALLKMLAKAKTVDSVFYEKREECALLVASALSATNEDCRKQVVDSNLLRIVVDALSSENEGIKAAACQCVRNLSRSVKNLRTNLFDAGVAKPLLKLLKDASLIVQTTACATICNMVLEFTPLKKVIVHEGAISDLIRLASHPEVALRINAIWSLKNLLYHSDNEIRGRVLSLLSFELISNLVEESDELIQEQALNLIRNIGCGRQENIEEVFKGFGTGKFINLLEMKLQMADVPLIVLQTLYIIVNVATGTEVHKSRIMESSILIQSILNYLAHENPKIRLASVWSLINLTWPNEPGFTERASFLIQLGAVKILKSLQNDPDYDVRQKVTCAIANFTAAQ